MTKLTKPFLPAYVFCYTSRTHQAFHEVKLNVGRRQLIDVQNSAPLFDKRCVNAWTSNAGDTLYFENGSAQSVVAVNFADVLSHMSASLLSAPTEQANAA